MYSTRKKSLSCQNGDGLSSESVEGGSSLGKREACETLLGLGTKKAHTCGNIKRNRKVWDLAALLDEELNKMGISQSELPITGKTAPVPVNANCIVAGLLRRSPSSVFATPPLDKSNSATLPDDCLSF